MFILIFFNRGTTEAEKNDFDNLSEKAQSDGTDTVEPIDHALGEIRFIHLRQVNIFMPEHIGIFTSKVRIWRFILF